MATFPPGLQPVEDLSPSLWVQEALKDWPRERFRVRDLVPPVFDSYARILHRPRRPGDSKDRTGTWAQRAATLGRELGPETTWWAMLGTAPYEGGMDHGPDEGRLNESEVAMLASFLGTETVDPSACWFALWSGFGIFSTGASHLRAGGTLASDWASGGSGEPNERPTGEPSERERDWRPSGFSGRVGGPTSS